MFKFALMYKVLFLAAILCISCVNSFEKESSDPSLNTDIMRQILVERHLLIAQITSFQYPDSLSNILVDSLFNAVCVKNGSSLEEFNQNWKHYNSQDIDQLVKIYDLVITDLKVLELKD